MQKTRQEKIRNLNTNNNYKTDLTFDLQFDLFRYSVVYFPPDNWRLVIRSAQEKDSASYICQVYSRPEYSLTIVSRYRADLDTV